MQACLPFGDLDLGYDMRASPFNGTFLVVRHDEESIAAANAPVSTIFSSGQSWPASCTLLCFSHALLFYTPGFSIECVFDLGIVAGSKVHGSLPASLMGLACMLASLSMLTQQSGFVHGGSLRYLDNKPNWEGAQLQAFQI